jgi:hypothetical protein
MHCVNSAPTPHGARLHADLEMATEVEAHLSVIWVQGAGSSRAVCRVLNAFVDP